MKIKTILEAQHASIRNVKVVPITPETEGDVSHGDWGFTPGQFGGTDDLEVQIAKATGLQWDELDYWEEIYEDLRKDFEKGDRHRVHKALIVPTDKYEEITNPKKLKSRFRDLGYSDSIAYEAQAWIQDQLTKAATEIVDLTWPPLN